MSNSDSVHAEALPGVGLFLSSENVRKTSAYICSVVPASVEGTGFEPGDFVVRSCVGLQSFIYSSAEIERLRQKRRGNLLVNGS